MNVSYSVKGSMNHESVMYVAEGRKNSQLIDWLTDWIWRISGDLNVSTIPPPPSSSTLIQLCRLWTSIHKSPPPNSLCGGNMSDFSFLVPPHLYDDREQFYSKNFWFSVYFKESNGMKTFFVFTFLWFLLFKPMTRWNRGPTIQSSRPLVTMVRRFILSNHLFFWSKTQTIKKSHTPILGKKNLPLLIVVAV